MSGCEATVAAFLLRPWEALKGRFFFANFQGRPPENEGQHGPGAIWRETAARVVFWRHASVFLRGITPNTPVFERALAQPGMLPPHDPGPANCPARSQRNQSSSCSTGDAAPPVQRISVPFVRSPSSVARIARTTSLSLPLALS